MVAANKIKRGLFLVLDIGIINLAYFIGFYVRYSSNTPERYLTTYLLYLPIITLLYILPMCFMKFYRSMWENAGVHEVINGVVACTIGYILNLLLIYVIPRELSTTVITLAYIFITGLVIGSRLFFRVYRRVSIYGDIFSTTVKEKVLIVGAGACGRLIINEILNEGSSKYKIVGLIDDDIAKNGTYLNGIKVFGTRNKIKELVETKEVDLILIAIPSIETEPFNEIMEICQSTKKKVKVMPSLSEMIGQDINLKQMRGVDLKDLLGREEITLDKDGIKEYISNKVVLVTGGGGSIGSELCRQISNFSPKLLVILDIYENNCYDLQQELTRKYGWINKEVVIASVRDKKRIDSLFSKYKPQVVFHAAAHKHVPLMEHSPGEAIKNNVAGTLNVAEAASRYGVERFVLISTDKAVNPTNVMGASKRLCEMIIQSIDKVSNTEFVAVRFGNVLGSNGSVIPLFKKQIEEGGPVTVTNKYITRYFMLIPEAAQLVLQAGAYAKGGEIFVLDMGKAVKIYDLAKKLIRLSGYEPNVDIKIQVTGLRPGEKLYEELLMSEEGLENTDHKKIFIGKPGNFDYYTVKRQVQEIVMVTKMGDEEMLRRKLVEIVPTYKRLDVINDSKEDKEVAVEELALALE